MQVRETPSEVEQEARLEAVPVLQKKEVRLFVFLGAVFITNALLAEFLGAKLFSLEQTLGFDPVRWTILGFSNLSFDLTAGVLLWPVVFIMTDIINEYYGMKGVRFLSYTSVGLILYAFVMVRGAMELSPSDFWVIRILDNGTKLNMDQSFNAVFGQGLWIIAGSLVAFLIGQLVDVLVFQALRARTGSRYIWLRATGSTLVSQFIDSFVVLFIAFKIGAGWEFERVLAIGLISYIYKFTIAIVLTPLLYLIHNAIDQYLGEAQAQRLMAEAAQSQS